MEVETGMVDSCPLCIYVTKSSTDCFFSGSSSKSESAAAAHHQPADPPDEQKARINALAE